MLKVSENIIRLDELMNNTFESHWKPGLSMMKFYLNHVIEDVEKVESQNILSASPFKRYNLQIKSEFQCTSERQWSETEKSECS